MKKSTLNQIATEPETIFCFEGSKMHFKGLSRIKGCLCYTEFSPHKFKVRYEIMECIKHSLANLKTKSVSMVVAGAGEFFDVLQIIAIAKNVGITALTLDVFELDFLTCPKSEPFKVVKNSLHQLVNYLHSEKVTLSFNKNSANDLFMDELELNLPDTQLSETTFSVNFNLLGSLEAVENLSDNRPKIIVGLDLVEGCFNPFVELQALMSAVSPGSLLFLGNKGSARVKAPPKPFYRNTVFFWHKLKQEEGNWVDTEFTLYPRRVSDFWAGFYSRAIEGGPSQEQLIENPYGPYYDRYRFEEDLTAEELKESIYKI